ncbi:MAG: UvrD-helicase domain-containing protein [Synergistaceae bacterium]|jgi:ATP-dependent exoDNAse (exonuclease V) beta subunit|nr:UvrD-helicase domain-containing protein [Synergistaceae bacterium]
MKELQAVRLVNASAGTGKTHSLTDDIAKSLARGIAPESLMATTFTNKAASELRERTRRKLLEQDLNVQALRIFDGFIGTVNSICGRLLTEYAIYAGLSPALGVVPEGESEEMFRMAASSLIESFASRIEPAARRLGRDGGGSEYQKRQDWRDDVRKIAEYARYNLIGAEALTSCAEASCQSLFALFAALDHDHTQHTGERIENDIDRTVASAIVSLEQIASPRQNTAKALDSLKKFRDMRKTYKRCDLDLPWEEWARLAKLSANKDSEEIIADVRRAAGMVLVHPRFRADLEMMIRCSFMCASDALKLYDEFKAHRGLMDFTDQEVKVLALAETDEAFISSLTYRISRMMVDEFQDTNPIQLALFLALHELTGDSEWVGDPKQAIYGFRGTDPQLMDEAARNTETSKVLDSSWRSKSLLVDFFNAIFVEVFNDIDEGKVRMRIPEERWDEAHGGRLELWRLAGKSHASDAASTAEGIRALLARDKKLAPGDIAVLCRKGKECELVASELEAIGIRASVPQGILLDTPEYILAIAALRWMNDDHDTLALTEIVHFSHGHSCHEDWLASLMKTPDDSLEKWRGDPILLSLGAERAKLAIRTPIEALKAAINCVDLPQAIKSWPRPESRRNNLDALCGVCREYMKLCASHRSAATVPGFINYLYQTNPKQAEGVGRESVHVCTYHKAKGLEWPVVVLYSLDDRFTPDPFGVHVVPSPSFDAAHPLDGRSIRYWPRPFGSNQKLPELEGVADFTAEAAFVRNMEADQSRRLMYVGMTRAREVLIFAARLETTKSEGEVLKTRWLDELADDAATPLIHWPGDGGDEATVTIAGRVRKKFPIAVMDFTAETGKTFAAGAAEREEFFLQPLAKKLEFSPAKLQPSRLEMSDNSTVIGEVASFGARISISGKSDMTAVGNAIHAFLGVDPVGMTIPERLKTAQRLCKNWDVAKSIDPSELLVASERLEAFIAARYPDAAIFREWPVTMQSKNGARLQGWIDMLIEMPESYAIIDHKSWPGGKLELETHAKNYAPQLAAYREAVERAAQKPVTETLIHLPVSGMLVEIKRQSRLEDFE